MVDLSIGLGGNQRAGVQGHPEAGRANHVEIIGAVPHCHGFGDRDAAFLCESLQPLELCGLVDNRRRHLLAPAMRHAARDAIVLIGLAAALFAYRMVVDPSDPTSTGAIDWRFHLVWLSPLVIVAFSPWIFHPYIVGGRDLPVRRPRASHAAPVAAPIATESPEWAAARRRGAA